MKEQEIKEFLNSLNNDEMEKLFNKLADITENISEIGNEENKRNDYSSKTNSDSFLRRLLNRIGIRSRRKTVVTNIKTSFEKDILRIINDDKYNNNPIILETLVKATIIDSTNFFKNSSDLRQLSGLNKIDYDIMVDDTINAVVKKYFEIID